MITRFLFSLMLILAIHVYTKANTPEFFSDKASVNVLQTAFKQLYNFDFNDAEKTIKSLSPKYADHPALKLFDCLMIYWKNFPVSTHPKEYEIYQDSLLATLDKCEDVLDENKKSNERIFYCLTANIMVARFYFENGSSFKAVHYMSKAFDYIKKGFTLQNNFNEFYFTTGLYKYYREFIPEQHPFYKTFLWLFQGGNKDEGLQYLDKATKTTVFVTSDALMFASLINLRYETSTAKGLYYADMLNTLYPHNLFYKVLYIENLIQSNQFEKAKIQLTQVEGSTINYYKLPSLLFEGMLLEKYYKKYDEAEKYYLKAVSLVKKVTKETTNYIGLAYYGLGNVAKLKGELQQSEKYYKKACDYCEYLSVKKVVCK